MGSYKGAGPDGIKPIVMKNFGPIALRCISFIFKAIYSTGYIPLDLRKSRVVFIPKPLKNDYGEAGSFRPISLTQYYFKTMEKSQTCNMLIAVPKVLTLHYPPL